MAKDLFSPDCGSLQLLQLTLTLNLTYILCNNLFLRQKGEKLGMQRTEKCPRYGHLPENLVIRQSLEVIPTGLEKSTQAKSLEMEYKLKIWEIASLMRLNEILITLHRQKSQN